MVLAVNEDMEKTLRSDMKFRSQDDEQKDKESMSWKLNWTEQLLHARAEHHFLANPHASGNAPWQSPQVFHMDQGDTESEVDRPKVPNPMLKTPNHAPPELNVLPQPTFVRTIGAPTPPVTDMSNLVKLAETPKSLMRCGRTESEVGDGQLDKLYNKPKAGPISFDPIPRHDKQCEDYKASFEILIACESKPPLDALIHMQ